jgi:hypothetical protein
MCRKQILFLAPLLIFILSVGACSNSVWDEVPSPISAFISEYFPSSGVSTFNDNEDNYYVKIKNGATLIFDKEYKWLEIDGNGVPLPETLAYNQFPPALFNYLQSIEQQSDVYSVKRDKYYYRLTMENTVISYDISTGKVSYPDGKTVEPA